jgi:hypothetical protein
LNVGLKADQPSAIDLPFVANLTAAQATIDVLTLEIRSVSGSDFIGVRFTGPATDCSRRMQPGTRRRVGASRTA